METLDQAIVEIEDAFALLKKSALDARKESVQVRRSRLTALRKWIVENRHLIHEAVYQDLKKPSVETDGTEIFHVLNELKLALDNLHRWTAPRKVDAPLTMLGTRSSILYEPKGICLIIAPWNYPFSLAAGPLVSALAAGNTIIVKPSELTPTVSALVKKMCESVFDKNIVRVIEGGPDVSTQLLSLPFDHIFFTGSPTVGKIVMRAAAEHLTSVTLELGGKSPAIVDASANLADTAKRIAVGKFINNGQTCIAPDYVLVDARIHDQLVEAIIGETKKLYADNSAVKASASYGRIVNKRHLQRLSSLLQDAVEKGATVRWGGEVEADGLFFHPTILTNVSPDSRVMEEEIFGPILPVISIRSMDDAITIVNSKPKPLALYVFGSNTRMQHEILQATSAGGVCINETAIHFLHHNLPFGGINNSGLGKSHGHYGFLAFSHEKPVLRQKRGFTSIQPFYPPYTKISRKMMDWFLRFFS